MRVSILKHHPPGGSVNMAWCSTLYSPGGVGEWHDDDVDDMDGMGVQVDGDPYLENDYDNDPSDLGVDDVQDNPEWRAWFAEHIDGVDLFLMLQIEDDRPAKKVTTGYSRKSGQRSFTLYVPVQEFLSGTGERTVVRGLVVELYQAVAKKLGLPDPPPDPGERPES